MREGQASVVNVTFPQMKILIPQLRIYLHENYDASTFANNLAIIKLKDKTIPDGSKINKF